MANKPKTIDEYLAALGDKQRAALEKLRKSIHAAAPKAQAPDGTCQSQMFLEGRDACIEVKATYTQAGSTLTMKWQGAGMTIGSVEGDTFTMNNEGKLLAYRRQIESASGSLPE